MNIYGHFTVTSRDKLCHEIAKNKIKATLMSYAMNLFGFQPVNEHRND